MTDFSTGALLYPLTKGDFDGHPFHGNQYETVAGGESKRPPVGEFQLTSAELHTIADILTNNGKSTRPIGDLSSGDASQAVEARADQATVAMAKMLGFDKPAQKVDAPPANAMPLFRGCNGKGAESLTEPLVKYTNGGGMMNGAGVYFGTDRQVAEQYKDGAMVQGFLDPNARIFDYGQWLADTRANGVDRIVSEVTNDSTLSDFEKQNLHDFFGMPTSRALAYGYQGVSGLNGGEVVAILDRSALKVKY